MRFVYPEFLWALSLLIVPIIIHLFSFRKFKTIYFSSLQFVQHIEQQNKSTQKLKHLLLLLCRLFVIAFIVIAFAQPFFPTKGQLETGGQPVLGIHIDNSFSMTMRGVEGELLSEAIEAARTLVNKAPLNTKILLSTNSLDGVESRVTSRIDALERLDHITASPLVRSYDEVVNWQRNTLQHATQADNFGSIQLVYLSDFQRQTNQFTKLDTTANIKLIPIKLVSQETSNLSIDSIWFDAPLHKVGQNNVLNIKVTNHGEIGFENVPIQYESEGTKRDIFVDIPAKGSSTSALSFAPNKNGLHTGVVKISDKQFFTDDDYYFTYQVTEQSSVLIVNGTDANTSVADIYRLDDFYAVSEIAQGSFTQGLLQDKNLIVLNGINEVASGLAANLVDFSINGGTVAIFLGKNVDRSNVNAFLGQLKLPLISKEIVQTTQIKTINYKDPFFKGVFEKEKQNLSLPGVNRFYLTAENPTAVSIIQLQNGKGLLYRGTEEHHAFLFASSLAPEFGSFTADILFPTVILRIGELSIQQAPLSITVGSSNHYPIYQKLSADHPIFLKGENLEFIPNKRQSGNVTYIDLSGPSQNSQLRAGIYDLSNNGNSIGKVAINYNRDESSIVTWSEKEIQAQLNEKGITHSAVMQIDKGISEVNLNIDKPYPYWKIAVMLALLFLIAEILIVKLWKNKIA